MALRVGIGLLGCGTVGTAVAELLLRDGAAIAARTGIELQLRHVAVRDKQKRRTATIPPALLTNDPAEALNDAATNVVVELIGGTDAARALTLDALRAGKHVVTANKSLLALHGPEVFAAARTAGRCVAFEAAVAGGIPLIECVRRGLASNRVDAIYGILNGTCNYILTRMLENNASYAHALADAQRLGFAEADPRLDVAGVDAAHKLTILASLAMRQACRFDAISVRGIEDVELIDLVAGDEIGYACKLLAIARRYDEGLDLRVQPTFVPRSHPLAGVGGPFNAVSIYGHAVGHVLLYGRGAGGMPTASAVVADIIDVAAGTAARTFELFDDLPDRTSSARYRSPGECVSPHYLRIAVIDRPGGIGRIATALGGAGVSIATIIQHEPPGGDTTSGRGANAVPVVVTTHPARHSALEQALRAIAEMPDVVGRPVCIPVLKDAET